MAVLERVRAKSLGELNPIPVTITVLSSGAWLQYGLSKPDGYIVAGNLPALTAAIYGFVLMLPLMHASPELHRVQLIFVAGCFVMFVLWAYLIFGHQSSEAISSTLGSFATAIFVVLAASPLTTMRTVIAKRDATSIYAPMTAAQCVNCTLWTVYGMAASHDVFVWGPNLTGLLLGLMQLALKLCYPSKDVPLRKGDGAPAEEEGVVLQEVI